MKLVIVESPSKAKTIEKYLGSPYKVVSSIGHIRDLPKTNKDAIDIEGGFVPKYEVSSTKKKVVRDILQLAHRADTVLLATDPDREGEAIAWHLQELIHNDEVKAPCVRITFNEITRDAVMHAIEHPRDVDQNLRKAQEARRVLDRLVGYDLSGLIWKKVRYGLSAGRVQSPALRILMEREREIRAFIPEDYFVITGQFTKDKTAFPLLCEETPATQAEADRIIAAGKKYPWHVHEVKKNTCDTQTVRTVYYINTATSRINISRICAIAHDATCPKLYQEGHITYMRTDSPALSAQAQKSILAYLHSAYDASYVQPRNYRARSKNAQEAHEAIRPTSFASASPKGATQAERELYTLIWNRTLSSQMADARLERTKIIATITGDTIPPFSATGSRLLFPGWLALDTRARRDDVEVPPLEQGDALACTDISTEAKQTQPPHRYTEAGLIKELEKRGIGRPSTYASIMQTLQERGYVTKEGKTLFPTDTGDVVSSFLEQHFMEYINDTFTASMEDNLDHIAHGDAEYVHVLRTFYIPFHEHVMSKNDIEKITNLGDADTRHRCPLCSGDMVIKLGSAGKFLSCKRFPECTGALTLEGYEVSGHTALGYDPETNLPIFVKDGRFGPYVQLGESPEIPPLTQFPKGHKKTAEEKELVKKEKEARAAAQELPQPKRASIPKNITPENITLEQALHLLALPRTLGTHPESGDDVIANIGRFGPYVGHGRTFASLKKSSGLDPYTITLDEALKVLSAPKALPKGTELVRTFAHPKTGKELRILKSKSGTFLMRGMKRLYLPDTFDAEHATPEEIMAVVAV
ncbi:MAG: type I DNA topoisomerase [Candidatus Pacebacteria bacterium]|nr:type I DNA topoisomerase [Candidatus Paceibacterota bacterium]